MQGVVQAYDPATGNGVVLAEPDRSPIALRPGIGFLRYMIREKMN